MRTAFQKSTNERRKISQKLRKKYLDNSDDGDEN